MRYIVLLLVAYPLFSQTLQELIDYALKRSVLIKQAEVQKELSYLRHKESKISRYGEINLVGDLTHYNIERTLAPLNPSAISGGTPVTTSKDILSVGVAYGVPLFTGYAQKAEVQMNEISKKMSQIKFELTKEQLIYNIRSLYLAILSQKELLSAQESYVKALEKLTKRISYEVKIGKKAKIDLLKSKSDLQAARTTSKNLISNINTTKAALASLVGKRIDKPQEIEITVKKPNFQADEIFDRISTLSKVKIEDMQLLKSDKQIVKSRSQKYPQITLNSYLGKNYGKDLRTDDIDDETLWQVGVGLKYNLLDFGKRDINIQKAKIAKIQSSLKRERILLDLKKDLTKALNSLDKTYFEYEGNLARLELTKKSEEIEGVRYESEAATLNDLLLAKAKHRLAKAKVIKSKYDYQNSIYYLNYLLEKGVKE